MHECGTPEYNEAVWIEGTPEYEAARTPGTPQWEYHGREFKRKCEAGRRATRSANRRDGFTDLLKMGWSTLIHCGMFSSDPQVARDAMILTAREQIGVQRQIAEAHRQEDQAAEERRMRLLARAMMDEMEARRGR